MNKLQNIYISISVVQGSSFPAVKYQPSALSCSALYFIGAGRSTTCRKPKWGHFETAIQFLKTFQY